MTKLFYHPESDCLFQEQHQFIDWSMVDPLCEDVSEQKWAVERYNREVPGYPVHLFADREDGLAQCVVCRAGECEIPTDCPGEKMTEEQNHLVCAGKLDYWSGVWL